jgi:RHS repeat-associated protein
MYSTAGDDYYISDRMGTVDALTNGQGQVVSTYKYTPYGSLTNSPGGPPNPIRFQGQYQDTETGRYHMGTRYYDPSLPRWTQGDPLNLFQDPRQANRYAYAGDDPINATDPTGSVPVEASYPKTFIEQYELNYCSTEYCTPPGGVTSCSQGLELGLEGGTLGTLVTATAADIARLAVATDLFAGAALFAGPEFVCAVSG